jgi:predicted metal-dependent phosphoesterase TrpH
MIIDTHIHAYPTSDDSKMTLEEIVAQARIIGLDGICITDHDSQEIMARAHEYRKQMGYPIFVGAEVFTWEGDVIVFGLERLPEERVSARYLLDLVNKANGVAISAHPFRQNNRGMGNSIREHKDLHGVEAFNGSTDHANNMKACDLAMELGIPVFGASDAHNTEALGKFATVFPNGLKDERDLIEAIKMGKVYPVAYTHSADAKWTVIPPIG